MTKRSSTRKRSDSKPASTDDIKKLVMSWGGFEKLVAEMSKTGEVVVEHNAIIEGKSGAKRQIDVLLRHTQGLYEHITILECKYWNKRVSRLHVDALYKTIGELNAAKGVIFSIEGFQAGAITQAKHDGIELFTVRLPTNREWGLPGRHIDFFLQFVQRSIRNIALKDTKGIRVSSSINLNLLLDFDKDSPQSSVTPIMRPLSEDANSYPKTFESLLISAVYQATREAWKPQVVQDGEKWTRKFWCNINFKPAIPVVMQVQDGGLCIIPEITFDLGLAISQRRYTFDRADKFAFLFAIDDHVRNTTRSVSREAQNQYSIVASLEVQEPDPAKGPVFENGSIMTIGLAGTIPFEDFAGLARGEIQDIKDS